MIISLPFIPSLQKNQYYMGNVVICENLLQKASVIGSTFGVANCFFSVPLFSLSPSNYFSLETIKRAVKETGTRDFTWPLSFSKALV